MNISTKPSASLAPAYQRSNEPCPAEVDVELTVAEGAVPEALAGVYLRNGPGKQEAFGVPYDHPFDGDGMVVRFGFDGGRVHYRNRFVRTKEFVREEEAGRMLYRAFGTNLPGGLRANLFRMRFKNAANTSLVWHGGRLLALWEGGAPHELDPVTLETRGRFTYDGVLRNDFSAVDRMVAPELPFSAHPTVDEDTGELFNFGTAIGLKTRLVRYRVSPDGICDPPRARTLKRMSFLHDFALTDRSEIFFLTPVTFDIPRTLLGVTTPVGSIETDHDAPIRILVFPRGGDEPAVFEAPCGFIFHFVGAWEPDDDTIIVDGCRMDDMPSAEAAKRYMRGQPSSFGRPRLVRYTLQRSTGAVDVEELADVTPELPTVPAGSFANPYGITWSIAQTERPGVTLFTGVARTDVDEGAVTLRDFYPDLPGEPLFVPDPESGRRDKGWLLTLAYRSEHHRTDLYVLDADDLDTVARLELPHHVPGGFHGIWIDDAPPR